jgi:hypothetical protein
MASAGTAEANFSPSVIKGLVELGPIDPFEADMCLELGISIWIRQSGIELEDARAKMLELRAVVLQVAQMDARTEPVPLLGRSSEADVLHLASYLSDLVRRAALTARCDPTVIVERALQHLVA